MIGWSRRNAESRRRTRWYDSLTSEEQDLERRYQRMVGRRFFPLFVGFAILSAGSIFLFGHYAQEHRWAMLPGVVVFSLPWVGPFLFIPTSKKWKAHARSQRQDT